MSVFGKIYASNYDEIYQKKNYLAECDYVLDLAKSAHFSEINHILDLGCGTGTHALEFARRGFKVDGIDLSSHMLDLAKSKANEQALNINFKQGDIVDFATERHYELIVSLFAVVGYLTDTAKLASLFKNVFSHLSENGVFIFDCWNGNAVLYEKPITKMTRFVRNNRQLYRFSETELNIEQNLAAVSFSLIDVDAFEPSSRFVLEKHQMRYFFIPELKYLLELAGFSKISFFKFLTHEAVQCSDWNMCVLAEK